MNFQLQIMNKGNIRPIVLCREINNGLRIGAPRIPRSMVEIAKRPEYYFFFRRSNIIFEFIPVSISFIFTKNPEHTTRRTCSLGI